MNNPNTSLNFNKKIFAIISLGFLGDTLLVEPMCRNIRDNSPDAKIIFIANEIFKEVAKGFESVDYVYGFDKTNSHKGILGGFKFSKNFPYKNKIDYAIVTHPHERSILLAKAMGAKNIISLPLKGHNPLNLFINKKREYIEVEIRDTYKADYNVEYLKDISKNLNKYDVRYKASNKSHETLSSPQSLVQS